MSWDHATVLCEAFPTPVIFQLSQQKYVIRTSLSSTNICLIRFAFTLSTSQIYVSKKWCWLLKINQFHQFLPHESHILLRSSNLMSSTKNGTKNTYFRWTNVHSQFVLFTIQVLLKLPRIVFPISIQFIGVHIHFVQDVPQDLQCLPMICERWELCWSATLPWIFAGLSWIVRQNTWVWGRERRKDLWGRWERTCACGHCQVRQGTRHDTWMTRF